MASDCGTSQTYPASQREGIVHFCSIFAKGVQETKENETARNTVPLIHPYIGILGNQISMESLRVVTNSGQGSSMQYPGHRVQYIVGSLLKECKSVQIFLFYFENFNNFLLFPTIKSRYILP